MITNVVEERGEVHTEREGEGEEGEEVVREVERVEISAAAYGGGEGAQTIEGEVQRAQTRP